MLYVVKAKLSYVLHLLGLHQSSSGRHTSHSCFNIPLDMDDTSHCNIHKNGLKADLLKQTVAIIWDEVPMQNRYCMEAVDRTLKDILDSDRPFGGIVVLWGGDFRQILPVVEKGNREDIVYACIRHSYLWQHVHIFHLTQNMRLGQSPEEQAFAQWFPSVGEGTNQQHSGVEYTMPLPDHVRIGGGTAREACRVFSIQLTQVSPILSQDHQGTSQRGQSLLLAMIQWMSSTAVILPSSLE